MTDKRTGLARLAASVALVALLSCSQPLQPAAAPRAPSPGHPPHTWIPEWSRPSLLCRVNHEPLPPVFVSWGWRCPSEVRQ